jgi:hypothetical protein
MILSLKRRSLDLASRVSHKLYCGEQRRRYTRRRRSLTAHVASASGPQFTLPSGIAAASRRYLARPPSDIEPKQVSFNAVGFVKEREDIYTHQQKFSTVQSTTLALHREPQIDAESRSVGLLNLS